MNREGTKLGKSQSTARTAPSVKYTALALGEGNFVLVVSGGGRGKPTAFYDLFILFRVQDGKIAEHWDTIEAIPPRDQWKNDNGKFRF